MQEKIKKIRLQKPITSYLIYRFLNLVTWKEVKTIKSYFYRNNLKPKNPTDILAYIKKFTN